MTAKLRTISEVSSKLGVAASVIKKWEEEFATFLEIPRNENNVRTYTLSDIETLRKIKNMKEKKVDNETISKLFKLQGLEIKSSSQMYGDQAKTEFQQFSSELTSDMIISLNKLVTFVESNEVKELLSLEPKLKQVENNIIHQLKRAVHDEVAAAADAHVEMNAIEFGNISDRITDLTETTLNETVMYQTEIAKERELLEKSISEREVQFISLVQERFRKEEEEKNESKWSLNYLKQFMGFAK
jgi:DNA-binding transcriptional MerR regulator